jgi:hypothetical protein
MNAKSSPALIAEPSRCELRCFPTLGGQKADKILDGFQPAVEWKGLRRVTTGSAKPLCVGSIPTRASSLFL